MKIYLYNGIVESPILCKVRSSNFQVNPAATARPFQHVRSPRAGRSLFGRRGRPVRYGRRYHCCPAAAAAITAAAAAAAAAAAPAAAAAAAAAAAGLTLME